MGGVHRAGDDEQGFANSDPRYRISYLKVWLRAVGNSILDIRMQTMGMTDDEAMHFMMDDAFQTRAEAEGKLQRAKLSSTQLPTYYVGTSEVVAAPQGVRDSEGQGLYAR